MPFASGCVQPYLLILLGVQSRVLFCPKACLVGTSISLRGQGYPLSLCCTKCWAMGPFFQAANDEVCCVLLPNWWRQLLQADPLSSMGEKEVCSLWLWRHKQRPMSCCVLATKADAAGIGATSNHHQQQRRLLMPFLLAIAWAVRRCRCNMRLSIVPKVGLPS